jgi:hypothetical protein
MLLPQGEEHYLFSLGAIPSLQFDLPTESRRDRSIQDSLQNVTLLPPPHLLRSSSNDPHGFVLGLVVSQDKPFHW